MPIKAIINGTEKEITRIPVLVHDIETAVYKDAWEVRDNQDRLLWYREDTLTGTSSISYKGYGVPLKSMRIVGNGQQTGTPSPDSIIMPDFCGKHVGTDWTIPIICTGQTVSVYLGQVETTRKIKKLVLTGDEDWSTHVGTYYVRVMNYYHMYDIGRHLSVCTHYPNKQEAELPEMHYCLGGLADGRTTTVWNGNIVFNPSPMISSLTDWKSYLSTQYTNGTPVTVWYVLSEPETVTINEPLAKIGDHADELITIPSITPQTGTNTLTVDTTLSPSLVSITGHIKSTS